MATTTTPLLLLSLLLLATAISGAEVSIYHGIHPPSSPASPIDTVLALARADAARLLFLSSKAAASSSSPGGFASAPVASGQSPPSYVVRAALGSPAQPLLLALDTSADAAWAPCSPCATCPSSTLFSQANSSSYASLPCSSPWCPLFQGQPCPAQGPAQTPACEFSQAFADTAFQATLSQDALRLAQDVIPSFAFGCVTAVNGPTTNLPKQGLLGLGLGPMALLAQAGNLYKGVFSYCLPSYKSYYFSGSLRLGAAGQPRGVRYTPLLRNPHRPSLYYVNVTGLSVGRAWVRVPAGSFGFDPNTGAGTVIDSGTVITRWTAPVYAALRDEFRRQVGAPSGYTSLGAFDTCFNTDEVAAGGAPPVTLHMDGGVDLTLPMENTLIHSSATPLACLAMAEAPPNVNVLVNVVANLQQQNVRVVFDVANSRVGFARESCN